jgi:hypothetical protein
MKAGKIKPFVDVAKLEKRVKQLEDSLGLVEERVRRLLNEAADRATERLERATTRPPPPLAPIPKGDSEE